MRKIQTIAAAAILILAVACSKSKDDVITPAAGEKRLVETVNSGDWGSEKETYVYDGQGRLASSIENSKIYEFDYTSPVSLIITRKVKSSGAIEQKMECTLNEKGAITKMIYRSYPDNTLTYTYEMTYNADGYMTTIKGSYPAGSYYEEFFEIVNGNPVSSKMYRDGALVYNRFATYDVTKASKGPFCAWSLWPSDKLFGAPVKNLMTEYKSFDINNVLVWHSKSTYEINAAGYVSKINTDYITDNEKGVTTYTYQ